MSPQIDLDFLRRRESEQVEWKADVADVHNVAATLSAFANDLTNLGGGYVVCGVQEEKDAHGFPRLVETGLSAARFKEVEGRVMDLCRTLVTPAITPTVTELQGPTPDRRILIFTQPATPHAHTFRASDGGKHYVRISRETREARNGVLRDLLVRKAAIPSWDQRPCHAANVADIDLIALRDTMARMGMPTDDGAVESSLRPDVSLHALVPSLCVMEPLTRTARPRNFAILLFGREPQKFIPGAFSFFSLYPGRDRSHPHAERHELAGTALEQIRRLTSLLEAQASTVFDKTDIADPNKSRYPMDALKEALVNTVAHRDYELYDPVRITVFEDRIELMSPGSLLLGVDPVAFQKGQSGPRWRNQVLAWFFNRLKFAQGEGQGIPAIRRMMKAAGCPPPKFAVTEVSVTCTLRANRRAVALTQPIHGQKAPRSRRKPR